MGMLRSHRESQSDITGARSFATTHWSVVLAAGRRSSPQSQEALATLCRTYWYALYAFIRSQGFPAEDARDLTQEFFARLIEKRSLESVDQSKGKFRSFLLAAVKHFLANERDQARAQKRGGGCQPLPLDFESAEGQLRREPAHEHTPEKLFARRWALTLLDQVLGRLREELTAAKKALLFDRLKGFMTGESGSDSYAQAAAHLGMTEGAVKVAVHRLRRRYRELLREEIAQTVAHPDEIDDEIRDLFTALAP